MIKKFIGDILALSCLIFAPISIILNAISAIAVGPKVLLKVGTILILFLLIVFVVSIIILLKSDRIKKLENKKNVFIYSSLFYTGFSVIINIIAWLMQSEKSGNLWNIYTIITLLIFSIVISLVIRYLRTNSIVLSSIVYLIVTAVPYFVILVGITEFFKGAKVFIPIGIYLLIYGITVTAFAVKKYKKIEKELNEKPYEKQF